MIGARAASAAYRRVMSPAISSLGDAAVGDTATGESHAWVELWDGGWIPIDRPMARPWAPTMSWSPAAGTMTTCRPSGSTPAPGTRSRTVAVTFTRLA